MNCEGGLRTLVLTSTRSDELTLDGNPTLNLASCVAEGLCRDMVALTSQQLRSYLDATGRGKAHYGEHRESVLECPTVCSRRCSDIRPQNAVDQDEYPAVRPAQPFACSSQLICVDSSYPRPLHLYAYVPRSDFNSWFDQSPQWQTCGIFPRARRLLVRPQQARARLSCSEGLP